jgi:hypothetical protein
MGILTRGILGPMINTTGAVIGKITNGQNVITGLREDTPRPATEDQAEQRYKFKLLRDFFWTFPDLIESGFKKKKLHQVPFNAAYQYNCKNAFCISQPIQEGEMLTLKERIKLNFPALSYSVGPVSGPNCGTAIRNTNGTCTFSWLAYPQSKNNQFSDKAGYVIWNATTGKARYGIDIAVRSALSFTVPIPPKFKNAELHFYMHFYNSDTRSMGNSIYLGSTL